MTAQKTVLNLTLTEERARADFETVAAEYAADPTSTNANRFARARTRLEEFGLAPKIEGSRQVLKEHTIMMQDHRVAKPRARRKHPSVAIPSDDVIAKL
jgi:hypothetical protein